ncbi:MAG: GntR family transcriptional regulator, partial [Thermoanaerobaculia bacterium]
GIVETQQGTGTFIAHRKPEKRTAERRKALDRLVDQFLSLATAQGFTSDEFADVLLGTTEEAGRR